MPKRHAARAARRAARRLSKSTAAPAHPAGPGATFSDGVIGAAAADRPLVGSLHCDGFADPAGRRFVATPGSSDLRPAPRPGQAAAANWRYRPDAPGRPAAPPPPKVAVEMYMNLGIDGDFCWNGSVVSPRAEVVR